MAVVAILTLPESFIVQSAVELATHYDQGRPKPIDAPDRVAKAVADRYLPLTLFGAASEKNAGPANSYGLRAEPAGNIVLLSGRARSDEDASRLTTLQRKILDLIIAQQTDLTKYAREEFEIKLKAAKQTIQSLDAQIKTSNDRLHILDRREAAQSQTIGELRSALEGAGTSGDASVGRINERLWVAEDFARQLDTSRNQTDRLLIEISRQKQEQLRNVSLNELELNKVKDAEIAMPPTVIRLAARPRKILYIMAALVGSLMFSLLLVLSLERLK